MNNADIDQSAPGPRTPFIIEMRPSDELTELVPQSLPAPADPLRESGTPPQAATTADPEFDAYMAVVKLLIGGTIEGSAELVRRLEKWETQLNAADDRPGVGEVKSAGDVMRFMLVGMTLSAGDGVRRQALKLVQASDVFWRLTGSATQPLVQNRFTGVFTRPLDRAFDRLVTRGQQRVNGWVELGRAQEPDARRLARMAYLEVVDEFIGYLAENKELGDLVQKKSVGLATEAVDEFRSRTVSADAMAENIVRRILRRPPRYELAEPSADVRQAVTPRSIDTP